eukprot:tig00021098_g18190.t1
MATRGGGGTRYARPASARPNAPGSARAVNLPNDQVAKLTSTLLNIDSDELGKKLDGLDQLLDFCAGAGSQQLEAIGSSRFTTVPVLLKCLRQQDPQVCLRVLQVLDYLICKCKKNMKVFLSIPNSLATLTAFFGDASTWFSAPGGLLILQHVCACISSIFSVVAMNDAAKASFVSEGGIAATSRVLAAALQATYSAPSDALAGLIHRLCCLVADVAIESRSHQDKFREAEALRTLARFTLSKLNDLSIFQEAYADAVLVALNALVVRNPTSQNLFRELGCVLPLMRALRVACNWQQPLFTALLLVAVAAQFENKTMQEANHFDADIVSASLQEVAAVLDDMPYAQYLFLNIRGAVDLLVSCVNNIDQAIMEGALLASFALLHGNPQAQAAFVAKEGLAALGECLHDYHVPIKRLALQLTCVLAGEGGAAGQAGARDEVRENGTLHTVVEMLKSFPAEDVDATVLETGLTCFAHLVTACPANQDYVRKYQAPTLLVSFLRDCLLDDPRARASPLRSQAAALAARRADPGPPPAPGRPQTGRSRPPPSAVTVASLTEAVCLALNNLVYRHTAAQDDVRALGGLDACVAYLAAPKDDDLTLSALTLLVNCTDTNPASQDALCKAEVAEAVLRLLAGASGRVAAMAGLLLSHLVWNHPRCQALFAKEAAVATLLRLIDRTRRQEAQEAGFYALLALINLSYQNAAVQDLAHRLRGVEVLLAALAAPDAIYEMRKSAAFCLGNLVRNHKGNQARVAGGGGVHTLAMLLNDVEDDELSKCAFNTLSSLEEHGAAKLVELVDSSLALVPARAPPPGVPTVPAPAAGAPVEELLAGLQLAAGPGTGGPWSAPARALEQYLPILNGLLYVNPAVREPAIRSGAVRAMLRAFAKAVPDELLEQAVFVLVNLSMGRDKALQNEARELGAFALVEGYLRATDGAASREARAVAYSLLYNLALNNAASYGALAARPATLRAVCGDCCAGRRREVRAEAAALLLDLFGQEAAQGPLRAAGAKEAMQDLVNVPVDDSTAKRAAQFLPFC